MSLTAYSTTTPENTELAGNGAIEIVGAKSRIKERYELDHNFDDTDSTLDPTEIDCDGYHHKVTLKILSSDPTLLTNSGVLYVKTVDSTQGLYFRNSEGIVRII